jgi:hypothetical protein
MDPIKVMLRTPSEDKVEARIVSGIPSSGRKEILRLWRPFIHVCEEDDAKWAWRWIAERTEGMIELTLLREGRCEGVRRYAWLAIAENLRISERDAV